MNFTIIGLLIMFILVLLCLLGIASYVLRLRIKDGEQLRHYLEKYKAKSIELTTHLKRLVELADEYELTEKGEISTIDFVTSMTAQCKILGNRMKKKLL